MAIIDVRAHLTNPSNPRLTTAEINSLSLALTDPGGTLFFAAGDYWVQAMEEADLDPAHRTSPYATGAQDIVNHWGQGGIQIRPGVSYVGEPGTRVLWSETLESEHEEVSPNRNATVFGAVSPFAWESDAYVDATIEAVVAAGQRTFTVDLTAGFAVGDSVVLQLGYVPGDEPEFIWWTHATIEAIDPGVSISLDRPALIPMQALPVGNPDVHTAHVIRKVARVVENTEIRNFELLRNPDLGIDTIQPELGVFLHRTRGTRVENLVATDVGAGAVVAQYCERVGVRNLHVKAARGPDYYGRAIGFANTRNSTAEDIALDNFRETPIFVEHHCTQIQFRNVHLNNFNRDRPVGQGAGLVVASFESDVSLDGVTVEGYGGYSLTLIAPGQSVGSCKLAVNDLFLRTVREVDGGGGALPGYPVRVQLRNLDGIVRHDRAFGDESADGEVQLRYRFKYPRVWAQEVDIPIDNDAYDVPLPDGLVRRGRLSYSDGGTVPSGLLNVYWVNGDFADHKIDLLDQFSGVAEPTGEFSPRVTGLGPPEVGSSENSFGEQLIELVGSDYLVVDRFLRIVTDDTMPAGKRLTIWLEYFPYEGIFATWDDGDRAYTQAPGV